MRRVRRERRGLRRCDRCDGCDGCDGVRRGRIPVQGFRHVYGQMYIAPVPRAPGRACGGKVVRCTTHLRGTDACGRLTGSATLAVTSCLAALTLSFGHAQSTATYSNPVLPGDYPDPSVIRVGETFWATATTSQWAPLFPLLKSTDLVNWTRAGAVFQDPPAWSAGNYWAPEIAQDRGRFFVYYTARRKNGPLCVAVAPPPAAGAVYGSRTDDLPGRRLDRCRTGRRRGGAALSGLEGRRQQPQDADADLGAAALARRHGAHGHRRELIRNTGPWEAHLVEGPYILRRDGWFYMFYSSDACCGRECNYKLGVARARRLLGPWERNPANPILKGNQHWKCPGHGSLVSDADGRTFLLYHAYDPEDFQFAGRQGLLDEVTWTPQGWPEINGGQGPSAQRRLAFRRNRAREARTLRR